MDEVRSATIQNGIQLLDEPHFHPVRKDAIHLIPGSDTLHFGNDVLYDLPIVATVRLFRDLSLLMPPDKSGFVWMACFIR